MWGCRRYYSSTWSLMSWKFHWKHICSLINMNKNQWHPESAMLGCCVTFIFDFHGEWVLELTEHMDLTRRSKETIQKQNGCAVNARQSQSEQVAHRLQKKITVALTSSICSCHFLRQASLIALGELSWDVFKRIVTDQLSPVSYNSEKYLYSGEQST